MSKAACKLVLPLGPDLCVELRLLPAVPDASLHLRPSLALGRSFWAVVSFEVREDIRAKSGPVGLGRYLENIQRTSAVVRPRNQQGPEIKHDFGLFPFARNISSIY